MFRSSVFKWILAAGLLLAAVGGYYAYTEYNRRAPSMSDAKPAFSLTASEVLKEFETKPEEAKKKYLDQILELRGSVTKIEKDEKGFYTIVLGEEGSMSAIRCVVDSLFSSAAATYTVGATASMRGVCVGYTPDDMGLGADLLLNRCYLK